MRILEEGGFLDNFVLEHSICNSLDLVRVAELLGVTWNEGLIIKIRLYTIMRISEEYYGR